MISRSEIEVLVLAGYETGAIPTALAKPQISFGLLDWLQLSANTTIALFTDEEIGTYDVGPNPSRTAVDLLGNCWVGSSGDGTVWQVTQAGKTRVFSGFGAARGVSLDRNGNVWVANSGNNTIQRIDNSTGKVSEQMAVANAGYLYGSVIDGNNMLWLADYAAGRVCRYDVSQFPSPEGLPCASVEIYGITVDFDGTVWAAGPTTGTTSRIDPASMEVTTIPTSSTQPTGIAVDRENRIWCCSDFDDSLLRYDPVSGTTDLFPVDGSRPHGTAADDAGYVYSVNMNSNIASMLDADTSAVVTVYAVGAGPYTYSDLTGFIYRNITLGR